jgi:hypothetical protein
MKGLVVTHMRLQQLSMWKYANEALVDQLAAAMTAVTTILNDEAENRRLESELPLLIGFSDSIESVEIDLPNILFCNCIEENCDYRRPRICTPKIHLNLGPDASDIKPLLGAILDFLTQYDRHDAKANGSGSGSGKEHKNRILTQDLPGEQEQTFRIIGSVVPDCRWTMKRLHILENFIPKQALYRIPLQMVYANIHTSNFRPITML